MKKYEELYLRVSELLNAREQEAYDMCWNSELKFWQNIKYEVRRLYLDMSRDSKMSAEAIKEEENDDN